MDVYPLRDPPSEQPDKLLDREAHVWLFDPLRVGEKMRGAELTNILSTEEQERASRFVCERRRLVFTLAHVGLRNILSKYDDIKPAQWRFVIGEQGRPEITPAQNSKQLRFNLSHTRGLVACLINRQHDCGVDVELMAKVRDAKSLARRFFSPVEWAELEKCRSDEDLRLLFCRYWTLKEAYIKALGKGLRVSLNNFYFVLDGDQNQIHFDEETADRQENWQLYQRRPTDEHMLSVAINRDAKQTLNVKIFQLSPPEKTAQNPTQA